MISHSLPDLQGRLPAPETLHVSERVTPLTIQLDPPASSDLVLTAQCFKEIADTYSGNRLPREGLGRAMEKMLDEATTD